MSLSVHVCVIYSLQQTRLREKERESGTRAEAAREQDVYLKASDGSEGAGTLSMLVAPVRDGRQGDRGVGGVARQTVKLVLEARHEAGSLVAATSTQG